MIIEDIYGNIITDPNLQKGKLEKAERDGEPIYIYFPFSEDEQEAYNFNNEANITQDKATCQIYEDTKATITYGDTDPFCYAYAREVDRGNKTIAQCPSELQARIEELVHNNYVIVQFTGDVTYKYDNKVITGLSLAKGSIAMINVSIPSGKSISSITDDKGGSYRLDTNNNIAVTFDTNKTVTTTLATNKKKARKSRKKK